MGRGTAAGVLVSIAAIAVMATLASSAPASNIGNEGCKASFWRNGSASWQEYRRGSKIGDNWTLPTSLAAYRQVTFLQALGYKRLKPAPPNTRLNRAARVLLRQAVAAYLNAAHEGVGYPYRRFRDPGRLAVRTNAALASLDARGMETLATLLYRANKLGCPL
ncbi:MAG: hypothetical protein ABR583_05295 [Gaiellaceae bacterium]